MLPGPLLCASVTRGDVLPRYLSARDEVWIRALCDTLDALAGRTTADVDAAIERSIEPLARAHGVPRRAVLGARHVLGRHYVTRVVAARRPSIVRREVFERAALAGPDGRDAAISGAAAALELTRAELLEAMFADRPAARRLGSARERPAPGAVVAEYNLALVQGIVLRSSEVRVTVRAHARSVVRYAKLQRLICLCSQSGAATTVALSGPLSVFHHTTKYGRALAAFLPAVVSTPAWSLEADCDLAGRSGTLRCDASDLLARPHALPRAADSAVERALARDVVRLGHLGWTLERESRVLRHGEHLFFPDFTLRRGDEHVLVEIVGFYTPDYLARKREALRAVRGEKIIVCLDRDLASGPTEALRDGWLLYRKRVDAVALVAMAARMTSVNATATREPFE